MAERPNIAAMAAAAALARNNKNKSISTSDTPSSFNKPTNNNNTSVAHLINNNKNMDNNNNRGGIAALAAAAARKKLQDNNSLSNSSNSINIRSRGGGGPMINIAALAAAAARSKGLIPDTESESDSQSTEDTALHLDNVDINVIPPSPTDGGRPNIAALAAAAARSKRSQSTYNNYTTTQVTPPRSGNGIITPNNRPPKSPGRTTPTPESFNTPGRSSPSRRSHSPAFHVNGGADSTNNNNINNGSEINNVGNSNSGVTKVGDNNSVTNNINKGGEEDKPSDPRAALMAMLNKRGAIPPSVESTPKSKPIINPLSGGGIAAAAAAEAAQKRNKKEIKSTVNGEDNLTDPRAALMSMLNKRGAVPPAVVESEKPIIKKEIKSSQSPKEEERTDPRAALMSMLNKRSAIPPSIESEKKNDEETPIINNRKKKLGGGPPVGGIAAMAAAAAAKKNKSKEEISSNVGKGGGDISEKKEEMQSDPRAALMSMLANRAAPPIPPDDEPPPSSPEPKKENDDPRAALMSMLANRAAPPIPSSQNDNVEAPETPKATNTKKKQFGFSPEGAKTSSGTANNKGTDEQPDPRAALMNMLNKRNPIPAHDETESDESDTKDSPPAKAQQHNIPTPLTEPLTPSEESPPSTPQRRRQQRTTTNNTKSGKKKKKKNSSKKNSNNNLRPVSFDNNNELNDVDKLLNREMNRPGMSAYSFFEGSRNLDVPAGPIDMDDYVDYGLKRSKLAGSLMSVDEDAVSLLDDGDDTSPRSSFIRKRSGEHYQNLLSPLNPRNLEDEESSTHSKAAEALLKVIEMKQLDLDSVITKLKVHKNDKRKRLHCSQHQRHRNGSPIIMTGRGSLAGLSRINSVSVAQMHNPIDMDDYSCDDTSVGSEVSLLSTVSANQRRIAKNSQKLASHIMGSPQDKFTAKQKNVPLKNDPEYSLYFRMLRYGFTIGAVRAALQRDGKPDVTRLDPDRPVYLQRVPKVAGTLAPLNIDEEIDSLNNSLRRESSTEVQGLEIGDNGLTDKGWECALESAAKTSGVRKPAYRKTGSSGSSGSGVISGSSGKAFKSTSPWLQSNVERGIVEGWLRKRTRRGRWVRRWYLLDSTGFYYSHSPPSSSSALHSKKLAKLVDSRCLGAKKVHGNPTEFEVWHPSQDKVIVALRAQNQHEMNQWVEGVNATSERQRVVDEVVIGSVIPENLVKNTIGMIEANNALHDTGYNKAHYRPASPTKNDRASSPNKLGRGNKLSALDESEYSDDEDEDESEDDSSDEGGIISPDSMDKFKQLLEEGTLPTDINATELSDRPKRPKLERQNSWPPLSLMSDGSHGTGESGPAKSKEEVEADLKRIEEDIKRLDRVEEEEPANPTEISTSGGGAGKGGSGNGDGTGGDGSGDKKDAADASSGDKDGEPKLKDDPKYEKYFKMMKMGLPKEVAQHAMTRDQMDPSILDLDPDKSLKSQLAPAEGDNGVPLKDDPKYVKYYKMMKMGLPKEAVQHAMTRDQMDPSILDLDPEKSLKSQTESSADNGPPLKDDPKYIKYFKMMKMGLPKEATKHAMTRDGLDPDILDMDPEKSLKSQTESSEKEDTGPPLKDDPKYVKYFKMMKMGLPKEAAKHAMARDGLDPNILDMDPEKSITSQESEDTGPPLKEDPKYAKYFKMLKMGLPLGAVKNALIRDGLDPSIMDLDHDKSVSSQLDPKKKDGKKIPAKPKGPKIRRKKVYWNQLDANEGTVWSVVKDLGVNLKYEKEEFERLFAQAIDAQKEKDKKKADGTAKKSKSARTVKVIDAKRGMNGDIILRKVKLSPMEVAKLVDNMDCGPLDPTELKALYEFMPTDEEVQALTTYLKGQKSREEAIAEMTPCEEYMIAMIDLKESEKKFQCIIFMAEFASKLSDIKYEVDNLIAACSELKSSKRWETLLAMILVLVNKINVGDEDGKKKADGFALESLSKLSETKAFDNKTTVLHYLVKVIRSTDIDILKFQEDIKSVVLAKGVVMERLLTSAKQLCEDSRIVTETAAKDGEEYRAHLTNPNSTIVDENGQNTGEKYQKRDMKSQRASVKELRQMCTFLPESEVPVGKTDTTHFERFALFSKLELQKALGIVKEANKDYIGVLEYFGEDMKTQATDFFGMIDTFMEIFDKVADIVEKEEEAKLKEARRALAKEAKLKVIAEPKSAEDADKIANALQETDVDDGAPLTTKKPSWRDRPILKDDPPPPSNAVEPAKSDPRAALMSMLNKRGAVSADDGDEKEEEAEDKSADPRGALMAMLNKRSPPPIPYDEPKQSVPPLVVDDSSSLEEAAPDPRAALMSMLNKRGGVDEPTKPPPVVKKPLSEEEATPDPRAALMSMLNKRGGGGGDDEPETPKPKPKKLGGGPPVGGIAAMAAAAAKKNKAVNESSSATESDEVQPDPRAALMSMLNKRAPPPSDESKKEVQSSPVTASKKEQSVVDESPRPVAVVTPPSATGRSRLLDAVAKARKVEEQATSATVIDESPPPVPPQSSRPRLLNAVAAASRKEVEDPIPAVEDSLEPSQASNPMNVAAVAAEAARKKDEHLEKERLDALEKEERMEQQREAEERERLKVQHAKTHQKRENSIVAKFEARKKELAEAKNAKELARQEAEIKATRDHEEQQRLAREERSKLEEKKLAAKLAELDREKQLKESHLAYKKAKAQEDIEELQRKQKARGAQEKKSVKLDREKELRARYEAEMERKRLERERVKKERLERERSAIEEDQRIQQFKADQDQVNKQVQKASPAPIERRKTAVTMDLEKSKLAKAQIEKRERAVVEQKRKQEEADRLVMEAERLKKKLAQKKGPSKLLASVKRAESRYVRKASKGSEGSSSQSRLSAKVSQARIKMEVNKSFVRKSSRGSEASHPSKIAPIASQAKPTAVKRSSRLSLAVAAAQQKQQKS